MTAGRRRTAAVVLLAGAAGLAAAWRLAAPATPPLYDGIITPADPYRYVDPPPGINHPPPDALSKDLPLVDNQAPPIAETTDENPPQAQLLVQGGSFDLPPGATGVTVTISPEHAPAVPPPDGRLDGNVYRFGVAAASTPLQLKPGSISTVVLRGPAGAGNATVEQFTGNTWHRLDTQPVGNPDTWEANPMSLGDFALVVQGAISAPPPSGGGGGVSAGAIAGIVIGAGAVAAIGGVLLALRMRRRAPAPPSGGPRGRPPSGGAGGRPPRRPPARRR